MTELEDREAVGVVREYFRRPQAAAVEILRGKVKIGDSVRFSGYTTDFTQRIMSIQMTRRNIPEAEKGDCVGLQVEDRVRGNDRMLLEGGELEVSL